MRVKISMTRNSDEGNSSGFFILVPNHFTSFYNIIIISTHETQREIGGFLLNLLCKGESPDVP